MKKFLLACLCIIHTAHAHVIDCPQFYPWTATELSAVPLQHNKGKGVIEQQKLVDAGLTIGAFRGGSDLQGKRQQVKGGYEIDFGIAPAGQKWLVCSYGKDAPISWWEQLDDREADCTLKVMKSPDGIDAKLTCK